MFLVEGGSGLLIQHRATLFLGMARVQAISPVDLALNPRGWLVVLRLRGSVRGRTVIEIVGAILCPAEGAVGKPGGALFVEALRGFRAMRNCSGYSRRLTSGGISVTSGPEAFRCPGRGCRRVGSLGSGLCRRFCAAFWAGGIERPHRSLPEVMMEQVFNLTGDLGIGSDPVALQRKCGLFWPMSDITLKACGVGGE